VANDAAWSGAAASDATREPGWYVIYDAAGVVLSLCWGAQLLWWDGGNDLPELPSGWTVGPSLTDLLRDAQRLNWLERHSSARFTSARADAEAELTTRIRGPVPNRTTVRAMVDAEIARERDA
jgi:hypothetical protein